MEVLEGFGPRDAEILALGEVRRVKRRQVLLNVTSSFELLLRMAINLQQLWRVGTLLRIRRVVLGENREVSKARVVVRGSCTATAALLTRSSDTRVQRCTADERSGLQVRGNIIDGVRSSS